MWVHSSICASVQGTTPSPYEAAAQAKKRRQSSDVNDAQDWRWQSNKRQKVSTIHHVAPHLNQGTVDAFQCQVIAIDGIQMGTALLMPEPT